MSLINNKILKYVNKTASDFEIIEEISDCNRSYYRGFDGDILCAINDGYGCIDWYLCDPNDIQKMKPFGWSYLSNGGLIDVNLVL